MGNDSFPTALLEEHRDEASFVWGHWEHALLHGPSPILHFVDGMDERLVAHVEALSRAPAATLVDWFDGALHTEGNGSAVGALALAMMVSSSAPLRDRVLDAVESAPQHRKLLVRALGLSWSSLEVPVRARLARAASADGTSALLDVLACRRYRFDSELERFLRSADLEVRASALRCVPWSAIPVEAPIDIGLRSGDERMRDAALDAALAAGSRTTIAEARWAVDHRAGSLDLPLTILAVTGDAGDLGRIERTLAEQSLRRQSVWALGLSGWPRAADLCLQFVDDAAVADLAAEGFEAISGIRVRATPVPSPDEDQDRDTPDEDGVPEVTPGRWTAPEPGGSAAFDGASARSSWATYRKHSRAEVRLIGGAPITGTKLADALRREPMRRRHVRALELSLRSRREASVDTLNWGWHQLEELHGLRVPDMSCAISLDKVLR
jgi:uncharacterized protein (TIGR02270 family)